MQSQNHFLAEKISIRISTILSKIRSSTIQVDAYTYPAFLELAKQQLLTKLLQRWGKRSTLEIWRNSRYFFKHGSSVLTECLIVCWCERHENDDPKASLLCDLVPANRRKANSWSCFWASGGEVLWDRKISWKNGANSYACRWTRSADDSQARRVVSYFRLAAALKSMKIFLHDFFYNFIS